MHPTLSLILQTLLASITFPIYYGTSYLGISSGNLHPREWATESGEISRHLRTHRLRPPKPLPAVRPRRLTLPSPPDTITPVFASKQKTLDQIQSAFFAKLPVEVRTLIYEIVFAGNGGVLHMVRPTEDHISHIQCTSPTQTCENYQCFKWWTPDPQNPQKRGTFHKTHGGLLPLLLTCRRIYTEAIPLLYSTPTFQFSDAYPFICFPTTIPPSRFHSIQHLNLSLTVGGEFDICLGTRPILGPSAGVAWRKIWEIVPTMGGLRDLDVRLRMLYYATPYDSVHFEKLMEPLMGVCQTTRFVVSVAWRVPDECFIWEWVGRPFEIFEVDEGVERLYVCGGDGR